MKVFFFFHMKVFFLILHNLWPYCIMVSFVTFPRGGIQFLWLCNRFPQLGLSHTCLPSSLGSVGGSPCPALWARPMGPRAVHVHTRGAVLLVWGHLDRLRWEPGAGGPWGQRAAALVSFRSPRILRARATGGELTGSEVALEQVVPSGWVLPGLGRVTHLC